MMDEPDIGRTATRKRRHEPTPPNSGKKVRESWVKDQVKKIFKKYGIPYYMPAAAIYGRAGASDFMAWLPPTGHSLLVETKADRSDRPTPLQQRFMNEAASAGASCMVVHRGNLAEFEAWLLVLMETFK